MFKNRNDFPREVNSELVKSGINWLGMHLLSVNQKTRSRQTHSEEILK